MGLIVAEKAVLGNKKTASPAKLLAWYDKHRRVLPWRALPGQRPDPYHVWLSEIMLQQTTVATVGPYYLKFLRRWPTLAALAKADLDEVFQMWAGLGYYRRARGLHECAQLLVKEYGGKFPQDQALLQKLPGLGPYTAAALRAIAFDKRANVVDGNVERVMARLFAVRTPLPKAKKELKELAAQNLPQSRYGDYAQALMDLGATVCTPRSPKCDACPWSKACLARAQGIAETLPARSKKAAKPVRYAYAFVLFDKKNNILLRKRPATGLLANMMEVPSSPWQEGKRLEWEQAQRYAPAQASWDLLPHTVRHVFTHFDLEVRVARGVLKGRGKVEGRWVDLTKLDDEALPSLMRKLIKAAI